MRIDFLGLQAFVAIAERGSFQRAAAHLNLSQTALSHRIRKLEDDLGVRLLSRTTREVTLTQAGLDLLPRARGAIGEIAASLAELREQGRERQARIGIGCLPTIAIHHLPKALARFSAVHPSVMVRVYDNSAMEILRKVKAGDAEFGVTILSAGSWDLEARKLIEEPFLLVCPHDHPLAWRGSVAWADLAGVPLVRISPDTGNRRLIDDALAGRRDDLDWRYEVQHVASAVSLVSAGVGLTVVPRLAMELTPRQGLATLALRDPAVSRTLGIVSRRGVPLSPVAEDLCRMIGEEIVAASTA